jgi:uncharacterized protein
LVAELETKSFDAYMDVKAFLERLFGCRVNLVLREAIQPRLRKTILKEALRAPGLQGPPPWGNRQDQAVLDGLNHA